MMHPSKRPKPAPNAPRRILMVLQYWHKEVELARKLARLIADLEDGPSEHANFLVAARYDTEIDPEIVRILKRKFILVETMQTTTVAHGHPWGCNAMVANIAMHINKKVRDGEWHYDAFTLLECDDVPLSKHWLRDLKDEWYGEAAPHGALVSGYYMDKTESPDKRFQSHINGNCMMAANICEHIPFMKRACPSSHGAWDVALFPHLGKRWFPSKLIFSEYKRESITEDDLFAPRTRHKTNPHAGLKLQPVLFHGVKGETALDAARKRLLG
jgi:hypothetical protein